MTNIILLLVCLCIGLFLQRLKNLPKDAHVALNTVILYVPLPATALLTIPHLQWDPRLIFMVLVSYIIFGASYLFFGFLGKRLHWGPELIGCLTLCAGLGNTSFVGFPIIEALYGTDALKLAILVDQPGTFFIVSSLGIAVAARYSHGALKVGDLFKRIFLFPPFLALLLAMTLALWGWKASGTTQTVLERLAGVLTPLALISVGLQLKWKEIFEEGKYLVVGLGFKLVLAPLLIFAIYSLLGLETMMFKIAVIEAAMAPMITACILAASHELRPKLAGMMVGVGVPLSFLTLGIWYYLV